MNSDPSPGAFEHQSPSLDPYAVQTPTVYATGDESIRPTGLTVIAVICLLAGIVGLLSGLFGLIGMFFGQAIASAFQPAGPGMEIQQQMQAEMNAITHKYMWITLPLALAGLAISAGMAAGGIGVLATKPWARSLLHRILSIAIVVELIKGVIYAFTQIEMGPIMQEYMAKIAGSSGNLGGQAMGQMMQVMAYVGIAFMALWTLVKIALMVWGRLYLNRPTTKAYFDAAAS